MTIQSASADSAASRATGLKPFRFGAKGTRATSAADWREQARRAEDLGYATFQVADHFGDQVAAVPAIMAAADATTTIQVGPLVAGVDFRNPAMFAKEAATIDLLSDGRFLMGIGAGWSDEDYAIGGIEQADANERIDRLVEAVTIMRGLWSGEPFSYAGEHFRVAEVDMVPKPVSTIPLLIGGGGRRILSAAAQLADIVSINPKVVGRKFDHRSLGTAVAELVDDRVGWVREAAGDRFDSLELQMHVFVAKITDDPEPVARQVGEQFGLPVEVVLAGPYFQIGSRDEVVENLQAMRERWGISYVVFQQNATTEMAPVVAALTGT